MVNEQVFFDIFSQFDRHLTTLAMSVNVKHKTRVVNHAVMPIFDEVSVYCVHTVKIVMKLYITCSFHTDMPQVTQIEHEAEGGFAIHLHDWTGATLNRELAQQGLFIHALIPHQNTLEEAFLGLTKGEE